ncbi:MAG: AAA family ATPase [Actinomycetota bacterium]
MKVCPSCGRENPGDAAFCSGCATPLGAAAAPREERKVVSILFCDIVGFTAQAERLDPEDVRATLAPYHARLREELERRGGTVEKFIGDAVVAVFGAPTAHEDDPERAVRAAIAIRDALMEEGALQIRIAVNTGEALVQLEARAAHGEGIVAGDVVNTAARLQTAAPVNGILVGEHTYRATRDKIVYRQAEPVEAKGKAEPVAVWEVVEARSRVGVDVRQRSRAPLVGRALELQTLVDALQRARREGAPQLVTVVGVPGIGKSRLVYELLQHVDREAEIVSWRQGRSLPYGEGGSFWALGEMVKAQAGVLESDGAPVADEKLRATVASLLMDPEEQAWTLRHLRRLIGLAPAEDVGGEQSEVFGAWRRFIESVAEERPLVLVFEDLHWADDLLLDFVDYLVEWAETSPLLVLGTARPELLARRPSWGGGKPNVLTVSLSPLTDGDTSRLLHELLATAVIGAELQTALLERAAGNPLYAEEFVRLAIERGGLDDLEVPESVQGIIAARLDSLDPEQKALLQDAAVVGKVFWSGALAALAGRDRTQVEELLHAAARREFVRRERRSSVEGHTEYVFTHALVRDVAYGQIPRRERADKHRRAAEWVASLGRPDDHAELLAHHFANALEYAQAVGETAEALVEAAHTALRAAGDRAFGLNAFLAAREYYRRALELSQDAERAPLLLQLGLTHDFNADERLELVEEALAAALAAADVDTAARAETTLSEAWWIRGINEKAWEHLRRAQELVASSPPSPATARVLSEVARFTMLADDTVVALDLGRQALALAEEFGLDDVRANTMITIGTARGLAGDAGGITDIERAIELALRLNRLGTATRGYINITSLTTSFGDMERASDYLAQAERLRTNMVGFRNTALTGERVSIDVSLGRWDSALSHAETFFAHGVSDYRESMVRGNLAFIHLARGEDRQALEEARLCVELGRQAKDPQALVPALGMGALVCAELGEGSEARALLEESLLPASAMYHVAGAWAAVHLDAYREELAALAADATPWAEAIRAVLAHDFARAAAVYGAAGDATDAAYAHLLAGDRAGGEAGAAQLAAALEFFKSVGARRYVARTEELLPRSA